MSEVSHRLLFAQEELFPFLEEHHGPLSSRQEQLVKVLELLELEKTISGIEIGYVGRPSHSRLKVARALVAKTIYNLESTEALLERLNADTFLRRICGFNEKREIPSSATFSRVFAEFASDGTLEMVHERLIKSTLGGTVVLDVSRDSSDISAREKAQPKPKETPAPSRPRGRPKKGEERPKEPTRLEKQVTQSLKEMEVDLPKVCDYGSKSYGDRKTTKRWKGYKAHMDVAEGGVPVGLIVTSASVHDSQVALPLIEKTGAHIHYCYELMDSAYDAPIIKEHSRKRGHVPIIDTNPRRNKELKAALSEEKKARRNANVTYPEETRYKGRTAVERAFSRLKDEFNARWLRVRGHAKVTAHILLGTLVLAADSLIRMYTQR